MMPRSRPHRRSRRRPAALLAASLALVLVGWLLAGIVRAEGRRAPSPADPAGIGECLECHAEPGGTMVRDGEEISVYVDPVQYRASVHGIVPCIRCHAEAAGPTHAEHPEQPLGLPAGRALRAEMSGRCDKCHAGIYPESYAASFHGAAVRHGDLRAATCVDCHGVHDIFSADDTRSEVHPQNVAATCAQPGCHPTAAAGFSQGPEHFRLEVRESGPILNWVWKFFIALILFDVLKDGPIVMFELLRRVRG